ncbi:MAG: response regulator [Gemmatimonadetes bacterium]|nr:response regulator [Gemmatimonadota bacterium]
MTDELQFDREFVASLSVLVVDDQEHVRRWIIRILHEMGITRITEVSNGREALAQVTAPGVAFDLILCDLKMPEYDGVELIRSMSLIGVQTAVILISVESERVLETSALLAEERGLRVLGVVAKPVSVAKLAPLVKSLDVVAPSESDERAPSPDRLRGALTGGALHLVYQPKIEMATGRLSGVEALARWRHPDFGPLLPNAFVQL